MTSHADKSSVRLFRSDTRESHLRGDEYRISVSESGRNRSRLSPRNTSMTRHAPPECPSEVTWASKRSSRVTWKQAMNRRPPQDWSNSRPDTFHRDDRVPFKLSEADESRKLDVCRLDECLSEPQSARGGVRDSAAPLTRWHLDKHVQRSGMASFHTDEFLHDHDTVEDWELMLVSEGKRSLLEQFNASKLQHSPEGGEEESSSVCPTATKTARDTLQSARNTPHTVAPLRRHAVQQDHAAEEEEEEEIIARFYADQHARRQEPQPHMGTDPTPLPSVPDLRYTQPNRQYDYNPHVRNQLAMASSSTIPQNIHDSHVKKEHARPMEDEPERTNWEHEGESTEKKQEPKLSTLEEFRQYVIQQKLQNHSKAHTRNAGENANLTHSPALTTNTEKRKQNENLNDISQSMGNTHMPLLKSNALHNNHLISSTKHTLGINTTETNNPQQDKSFANARWQDRDVISHAEEAERSAVLAAVHRGATAIAGAEALSRREQQDRDVISHAEEAERSAVLAAAHRGATAIAGAEALSRREQQDRDVISHAEEAERSAVLAAAQSVHFVWGTCGFYGGENVLGLREKRDSIASWPLRVGALDPKSVNSVEALAAVSPSGMSLDAGLGVSDEGSACATAVSRVNDAKFDGILLTGGCELTQLNVRGGVLLAEETASSLRVEAEETEVQSDMLGKVAVHPALRTGEVRATTIPHGEPLGDDSDDDIPIHPRYTFFGCLLSPFVCCMSRRQTQMSRIEDRFSNE